MKMPSLQLFINDYIFIFRGVIGKQGYQCQGTCVKMFSCYILMPVAMLTQCRCVEKSSYKLGCQRFPV